MTTLIQKLLLSSIAERDISVQETCHLLLSLPLYHSNRQCITLNLNEDSLRLFRGIRGRIINEHNTTINERGRTTKSNMQRYWDRPEDFEDLSLFHLYSTHKYTNGRWNKSTKENIVRIWPRPSSVHNGEQWEEFCRIKVILHVPHRSLERLKNDENIPWSTIYNQNREIINSKNDILGQEIEEEVAPEAVEAEGAAEPEVIGRKKEEGEEGAAEGAAPAAGGEKKE